MANQISQLADAVSRLDTQPGKLPSQPTPNVRNVSAISMSCGMDLLPEKPSEPVEIASSKETWDEIQPTSQFFH